MWIKEIAKSALTSYPTALGMLRRVYQIPKDVAAKFRYTEEHFLDRLAERGGSTCFLQIGAHDGKTDDSLYPYVLRYGWRGVLVEPVAELFERLKQNYRSITGIQFENAAISDHDGIETFYRLDARAPDWCNQLGSLRRDVVLANKYVVPDFDRFFIEDRVRSMSFKTLIERHRLAHLDLILIDTEGYDFEILRQIDFTKIRPQLVIYEQQHLPFADKRKAIDLLTTQGYEIHRVSYGLNNVAVRRPSK
jgi:FkbM family methyltransferase